MTKLPLDMRGATEITLQSIIIPTKEGVKISKEEYRELTESK